MSVGRLYYRGVKWSMTFRIKEPKPCELLNEVLNYVRRNTTVSLSVTVTVTSDDRLSGPKGWEITLVTVLDSNSR